ncbi:MAG TPA: wax ester/triacylglycerol synthase family O-acyltransferase, partial [Pseudonocardiaceae bacterium]
MAAIIDPTSLGFLLAETRSQPMHVAGLQLFEPPEGTGEDFARELFESALDVTEVAPLFTRRPAMSIGKLGQWVWTEDKQFDIEHHVRHNALPRPGRIRELLELVSRLHGTMLARERPLWEAHIIEGLADGRVAMYTKLHHALVDGISAMRLMQSVLTTDPDRRHMPLPFEARATARTTKAREDAEHGLADVPMSALRSAVALTAEAAGLPAAFIKTLTKGVRNETSALSLHAPKTMFNVKITGSRRFAAQDWPLERIRAISKASGTTLNDVVLAMCSGAVRTYLEDLGRLPDTSLVSMVPVGLKSRRAESLAGGGGNAVGSVMVQLGTHLADPADRLASVHRSMKSGKDALASMTPNQIVAMSALGMAPSIVIPMLRLNGLVRPPFNLI